MSALRLHRFAALVGFPLLVYIVGTGAATEWTDLFVPQHLGDEMPESRAALIYGPPNFRVQSAIDYDSSSLANDFNFGSALAHTATLARSTAPDSELRFVEVRSVRGRPIGHARMNSEDLAFDLDTDARLSGAAFLQPQPSAEPPSLRQTFANLHRPKTLGTIDAWNNLIAGLFIVELLVSGLIQYRRLWKVRGENNWRSLLWCSADRLRSVHRGLALIATLPVLWLLLSGLALSVDSVIPALQAIVSSTERLEPARDRFSAEFSRPISESELAPMTAVTLAAYHHIEPAIPIKVVRLRYFGSDPQGVVIAADDQRSQYVFSTRDGQRVSIAELRYPKLFFPGGWKTHQTLKQLHRGDYFGLTGQWIASITAASLLFLLGSGATLWVQEWRRRCKAGQPQVFWP